MKKSILGCALSLVIGFTAFTGLANNRVTIAGTSGTQKPPVLLVGTSGTQKPPVIFA